MPCKKPNFFENRYIKKKKESIKNMKKSGFAKMGSLFPTVFWGSSKALAIFTVFDFKTWKNIELFPKEAETILSPEDNALFGKHFSDSFSSFSEIFIGKESKYFEFKCI